MWNCWAIPPHVFHCSESTKLSVSPLLHFSSGSDPANTPQPDLYTIKNQRGHWPDQTRFRKATQTERNQIKVQKWLVTDRELKKKKKKKHQVSIWDFQRGSAAVRSYRKWCGCERLKGVSFALKHTNLVLLHDSSSMCKLSENRKAVVEVWSSCDIHVCELLEKMTDFSVMKWTTVSHYR